jgi:hypothetical protein
MTRQDILMAESLKTEVMPTHQCRIENGIEHDEIFTIVEIIGYFEQVMIRNQHGREYKINPNQLV